MKHLSIIFLAFLSLSTYQTDLNGQIYKLSKDQYGNTFDYPLKTVNEDCTDGIYRSIDGSCNNISDPSKSEWGAAHTAFLRLLPADYGMPDPMNDMNGQDRKSPREISNMLCAQSGDTESEDSLSSFVFTWGQFIDHDVTLTPIGDTEFEPIPMPDSEPLFTVEMEFFRSEVHEGTGIDNPRNQTNINTAWIDGSMVYGSDIHRANWLRTFSDGKLKTSTGNFLPYNTIDGEINSPHDPDAPDMEGENNGIPVFVAGDVRANEQSSLLSIHTLFVREHNRICEELVTMGMTDDESIYQTARKKVGAMIQAITYREFLPALKVSISDYEGYDAEIEGGIASIFATAAYRMGHTVVTDTFLMVDNDCNTMAEGNMPILETFFDPTEVVNYGIDPFLKGMSMEMQQEFDIFVIDALRNLLFLDTEFTTIGFDLIALNLQRGRDHGIPTYNTLRSNFNSQSSANAFSDICSDPILAATLAEAYDNDVNKIDAWIGLMIEDDLPNKIMGETNHNIIKTQFERLRDGDRFYYENDPAYTDSDIAAIQNTYLSDIILRNTSIETLPQDVFHATSCKKSVNCEDLTEGEIKRAGALYAPADFDLDGNEIYIWSNEETGEIVAQFVGTPYYSPNQIGSFTVTVSDPDLPECEQTFDSRTITTLDGCCELED